MRPEAYSPPPPGQEPDHDPPYEPRPAPPWFPLYVREFLASPRVGRMGAAERGLYLTLLLRSWDEDGYVLELEDLADELDLEPAAIEQMLRGRVGRCFYADEHGRLRSERLETERDAALSKMQQRRDAGRASAAKRAAARNATPLPFNGRSAVDERASGGRSSHSCSVPVSVAASSPGPQEQPPPPPPGMPGAVAEAPAGRVGSEGEARAQLGRALERANGSCTSSTRQAAERWLDYQVERGLELWTAQRWSHALKQKTFPARVTDAIAHGRTRLARGRLARGVRAVLDEFENGGPDA
ncbi:MAG: hypothetical protein AAFP22_07545 [Planctomycetota bacterium]